MKYFTKLLGLTFLLTSLGLHAELAVIVHPSNNDVLNKSLINRIFLGKSKSFPSGASAIPINQETNLVIRGEFNKKVLKKSASQVKAYWSKLLFTGKGQPPKEVSGDSETMTLIAENPNLIGYVDKSSIDSTVRMVGNF